MPIYVCENPAGWHPTLHTRAGHHHPPLAWRRKLLEADPAVDQSWWRIVSLCPLCHEETHSLLDAHVRVGGVPASMVTKTYGRFIRALVAEAWEHKPSGKPPYTLAPEVT